MGEMIERPGHVPQNRLPFFDCEELASIHGPDKQAAGIARQPADHVYSAKHAAKRWV